VLAQRLHDLRARRAAGESGFTLVELLVVVVIVVALAAIAVPIYLGQKDKAENAAVDGDIAAVGKLITSAVSQEAETTIDGNTVFFNDGDAVQSVTISEGTLAWGAGLAAQVPTTGTCIEIEGADGGDRKFTVPTGVAGGTCPVPAG